MDSEGTRFDVAPNESDWYYCAIGSVPGSDVDYVDGYASGARPTITALRETDRLAVAFKVEEWSVHRTQSGRNRRA
jgi:hypothetical protein